MRTLVFSQSRRPMAARGFTLIELLVFIVVVSIGLVALLSTIGWQVTNSVDPVAGVRATEKGQALLDEILSRKFADNTPTGGVPACSPCDPIGTGGDEDDVGDYHGYDDAAPIYGTTVTVVEAGTEIGLASDDQARLITVTVQVPNVGPLRLSAYRTNF